MVMKFAVMPPAQWHRELVADLAPERATLAEAQMMSVTGTAATDEAGLIGHVSDMLTIPYSAGFR